MANLNQSRIISSRATGVPLLKVSQTTAMISKYAEYPATSLTQANR